MTVSGMAAAAAVVSRVNKVVVGARALLAGGALLADAGLRSIAVAAKYYGVPVSILSVIEIYCIVPRQGDVGGGSLRAFCIVAIRRLGEY